MGINTGRTGEVQDTKTDQKPKQSAVQKVVESTKQKVHDIKK